MLPLWQVFTVLSKQGAHACWQLGDVGRARELIEKAFTRALKSEHAPTLVNTYNFKVTFETLVGDAEAALRAAASLVQLSMEHKLPLYLVIGSAYVGWASARLGDPGAGATKL